MITFQEAYDQVETIVSIHPDRFNPMDGRGSCLNTDPHDPDRHCIAAQVLVDLGKGGWLENSLVKNNSSVFDVIFANNSSSEIQSTAVSFLSDVQSAFDAHTQNSTPWGEAWADFKDSLAKHNPYI